jgi:hypothetical protein
MQKYCSGWKHPFLLHHGTMLMAFDSDVRRENTDVRWVGFSLKPIVTFSQDILKFFFTACHLIFYVLTPTIFGWVKTNMTHFQLLGLSTENRKMKDTRKKVGTI